METRNSDIRKYQQGDVNIWSQSIPAGVRKKTSPVVREGEATGHSHTITGTDFEMYEMGDRIFARILSCDCRIVHEEHKQIELPIGDYEFGPTYEYDYEAEESRQVVD